MPEQKWSDIVGNILGQGISQAIISAGQALGGPSARDLLLQQAEKKRLELLEREQALREKKFQEEQARKKLLTGFLSTLDTADPESLYQAGLSAAAAGEVGFGSMLVNLAARKSNEKTNVAVNKWVAENLFGGQISLSKEMMKTDPSQWMNILIKMDQLDPENREIRKETAKAQLEILKHRVGMLPKEEQKENLRTELLKAQIKRQEQLLKQEPHISPTEEEKREQLESGVSFSVKDINRLLNNVKAQKFASAFNLGPMAKDMPKELTKDEVAIALSTYITELLAALKKHEIEGTEPHPGLLKRAQQIINAIKNAPGELTPGSSTSKLVEQLFLRPTSPGLKPGTTVNIR